MSSFIRSFLPVLIICNLVLYPLPSATAFNRVLSVPQQSLFISIEQRKYEEGKVKKAFLRTSNELYPLYEMEGLILRDSKYTSVNVDNDKLPDLIWQIELEDEQTGDLVTMWITTLSSVKLGWVFFTPKGATRWNNLNMNIEVPQNVILYFSPSTPEYRGITPYKGNNILTFAYTIAITSSGPSLVSVPEVYEQLEKIHRLVIASEADPQLLLIYENICDDYQRMSEGRMPSKEAILNFKWERVLDFELK